MGSFRSGTGWGKMCRLGIVGCVMASVLLSGCASQYGRQITVVQYYPECYAPIAKLRAEEKQFVKNVATGAIVGALAGAAIGAALGDWRGALAGAGAGLVVGAGVAAALTKYKEVKDDRERRSYLSRDMAAEAATLDRVGLSAALASKCYRQQFDKLLADYNAGGMSKEIFQARALEIISGLNEIAVITKSFNGEAAVRLKQYQDMLVTEAQRDNSDLPAMRPIPLDQSAPSQPSALHKAKSTTKSSTGKKRKKKSHQEQTDAADGQPNPIDQLLAQPPAEVASVDSSPSTPAKSTATEPDIRTMPGVISNRAMNAPGSMNTAVGKSDTVGPDPTTMPGVIARRDNYKAKADDLVNVQKETSASMEACIAKAEAAGVAIPTSLKPKTASSS
jgi:outer membrane lipoprotein SlyB